MWLQSADGITTSTLPACRQRCSISRRPFRKQPSLIVSVGDRDYKTEEGELRTMPGIKNLVRYQQNLAADEAVAFWNMFEAMGGEGSMADMVHAVIGQL